MASIGTSVIILSLTLLYSYSTRQPSSTLIQARPGISDKTCPKLPTIGYHPIRHSTDPSTASPGTGAGARTPLPNQGRAKFLPTLTLDRDQGNFLPIHPFARMIYALLTRANTIDPHGINN